MAGRRNARDGPRPPKRLAGRDFEGNPDAERRPNPSRGPDSNHAVNVHSTSVTDGPHVGHSVVSVSTDQTRSGGAAVGRATAICRPVGPRSTRTSLCIPGKRGDGRNRYCPRPRPRPDVRRTASVEELSHEGRPVGVLVLFEVLFDSFTVARGGVVRPSVVGGAITGITTVRRAIAGESSSFRRRRNRRSMNRRPGTVRGVAAGTITGRVPSRCRTSRRPNYHRRTSRRWTRPRNRPRCGRWSTG